MREKLLEKIKAHWIDEDIEMGSRVSATEICDVMAECGFDFYLEELKGRAGDCDEGSLYLDYYDVSIHRIVLLYNLPYFMSFDTVDDLIDEILKWEKDIKDMKNKLLSLKDWEDENK